MDFEQEANDRLDQLNEDLFQELLKRYGPTSGDENLTKLGTFTVVKSKCL